MKKTQFFLVAVLIGTVFTASLALAAPLDDLDQGIIPGDRFGVRDDVVRNDTTIMYDVLDFRKVRGNTFDVAIRIDPNRFQKGYTPYLLGIDSEWECIESKRRCTEGTINKESGMAIFRDVKIPEGTHGFTAAFKKGDSIKWHWVKPSRHTIFYGHNKVKYTVKVDKEEDTYVLVPGPRAAETYFCCPEGK